MKKSRKIRYAVVGLGYISQCAVLPAFAHAPNAELAALVSGDPEKLRKLGKRYGVSSLYSYDEYEECLTSGDIDAVYIALPNHMHREYSVRAARCGVHVLCEKPMALTEEECEDMIGAARYHDVKLMIAYRLHFEEANLKAIEAVRSGRIGDPRVITSVFSMPAAPGNIRLKKETGGGPLFDLGIYCINASRYLFGEEPLEVSGFTAKGEDPRFADVEETVGAILRFPKGRLATFACTFGGANQSYCDVVGTKGTLCLDPVFDFQTELRQYLTANGREREKVFSKRDHFGPELGYFSDCILEDRTPEPSGLEGLNDVRIIRAIYQSAEMERAISLPSQIGKEGPSPELQRKAPPVKEPRLVNAEEPVAA